MEMKTDPCFEADDDVFYAELRRQILLLTLEDDDENPVFPKDGHMDTTGRAKQGAGSGLLAAQLPGNYFGWSEIAENRNGTGVFIPRIAKSRRRPKSERRNNARQTIYKPIANENE